MQPVLRLISLIVFTIAIAPLARSQSHTETFSTTTYKDPAATTAWWDTGAGGLRLYPRTITEVGSYATPAAAMDVAVAGNLAYLTVRASGVRIVDITDPAAPAYAGSYDAGGNTWGLYLAGDVVFVTVDSRVQAVGIANPALPITMDSYTSTTTAYGIEVKGSYAYVANGSAGLLILDVGDPTNITLKGSYNTAGSAIDVAVAGDLAFVADRGAGLTIVNIQDPTAPTFVGNYDTPGDTWGVAVDGDFAYLGDAAQGVHVIDIANPYSPALLGSYNTSSSARGIRAAGDYIYVADYGYVHAVDVSDPSTPVLAETYDTPGVASNVALAGEYVFVADGAAGGLRILKVCDFLSLPRTALTPIAASAGADFAVPVGNYMYVGHQGVGLEVYDITDITTRVLVGTWPSLVLVDIVIDGDLMFGVGPTGLTVLNIQNPAVPVTLGSSALVQSGSAVTSDGDFVYVLDAATAPAYDFSIFSVADPTKPVRVGGCNFSPSTARPQDVAVQGSYAYVAAGTAGLQIVNVATPSSPFVAATYAMIHADGVAVEGNTLLVTDGLLYIFSVTNPVSPSLVTTVSPTHGYGFDCVEMSGDIAFAGTGAFPHGGAELIDISNLSLPRYLSFINRGHTVEDIRMAGDFLFTSTTGTASGWTVSAAFQRRFDMSRSLGQSVTFASTSEDVLSVRVTPTAAGIWSHYIYWISADAGVNWKNVIPYTWTALWVPGKQLQWRCQLEYAFTEPMLDDLLIEWTFSGTDVDALPALLDGYALLPPVPNPSPMRSTVRFALPRQEHVQLRVFDVLGREVATLAEGTYDAGISEVTWDGRADDGGRVSAGTYFARLRAGDYGATRKIVLQR